MAIAKIIVDVPLMQTDQPYSYRIPEEFEGMLEVGMRVHVPFGKGNRLIQGIVLGLESQVDEEGASQDLKDWVNIIAANKDWEKSNKADAIKTLIKAYQNDEVAQIIYDASNKVDLPAWKGAPTQDQLKANSKK